MRDDYFSKINEKRDCIDQRLNQWVVKLGLTPMLVPNLKTKNLKIITLLIYEYMIR